MCFLDSKKKNVNLKKDQKKAFLFLFLKNKRNKILTFLKYMAVNLIRKLQTDNQNWCNKYFLKTLCITYFF